MSKRVLFVDDEGWSVSAYFEILEDNNITIDLAQNGDQAIECLRQNDYDLLVLDIMFPPGKILGNKIEPRKAGATLLSKIRNNKLEGLKVKPDVPVLMLTAVIDQHLLDNITKDDVDVFRKPARFDEVVEKIEAILA